MGQLELEKIAEHLGLTPSKFKRKFKVKLEEQSGEWYIDAQHGGGCPLLTEELTCSVHPVKPLQCATFPFWDEMLDDAGEWEAAKSFCPGLDAPGGQLYTRGQIAAIRAGWTGT
jgi:Fe-S-cluster containining protein